MKRRTQILRGIKEGDWVEMKLRSLKAGTKFRFSPEGQQYTSTLRITEGPKICVINEQFRMTFFSSEATVLVQWTGEINE